MLEPDVAAHRGEFPEGSGLLVWEPCKGSRSLLYPRWEVSAEGKTVEEVYRRWVDICGSIAARLQRKLRPVDVERGFFYLLDHNKARIADEYLSSAA